MGARRLSYPQSPRSGCPIYVTNGGHRIVCNRAQGFHLLPCESWREKKLLLEECAPGYGWRGLGLGPVRVREFPEKPIPMTSGRRFWDSSRVFFFGRVRLLSQRLVSTERAETVYEKQLNIRSIFSLFELFSCKYCISERRKRLSGQTKRIILHRSMNGSGQTSTKRSELRRWRLQQWRYGCGTGST